MSLQEEITSLVYDDMGMEPDIRISKIINRVLDKAIEAMDAEVQSEHDGADEYNHRARESYLYCFSTMRAAINKLRGEK